MPLENLNKVNKVKETNFSKHEIGNEPVEMSIYPSGSVFVLETQSGSIYYFQLEDPNEGRGLLMQPTSKKEHRRHPIKATFEGTAVRLGLMVGHLQKGGGAEFIRHEYKGYQFEEIVQKVKSGISITDEESKAIEMMISRYTTSNMTKIIVYNPEEGRKIFEDQKLIAKEEDEKEWPSEIS